MSVVKYIAALIIILTGAAGLFAMPPHPDFAESFRIKGINGEKREKISADFIVQNEKKIRSLVKAYPASGTFRIPVLLVTYDDSYPSAAFSNPAKSEIDNLNMPGIPVPVFMLMIAFIIFLYMSKRSIVKAAFPLFYIFFTVMFLSCGVDSSGDKDEFSTDVDLYDKILNGTSSFTLSAKKYFSDMSNNNLGVKFDFFGPVKVSKKWDYYGENESGADAHAGELVAEAVRLMVSKYRKTDFSRYDNNGDGLIESVLIIHEGPGEESGAEAETIWSHEYDLYSAGHYGDGEGPVYTDGVYINSYAIVPEYTNESGDSTIGVFCHELGHALGLSDMYDTSTQTDGAGDWSIMGTGSWGGSPAGSKPAPMLAWERYKLGGTLWVTITDVTASGTITVQDIETAPVQCIKYSLMILPENSISFLKGKKPPVEIAGLSPGVAS